MLAHAMQNDLNVTQKKFRSLPHLLNPTLPSLAKCPRCFKGQQDKLPLDSQSPDCLLLQFPSSRKAAGLSLWTYDAPIWPVNICLMLLTFCGSKKKRKVPHGTRIPWYQGNESWDWSTLWSLIYPALTFVPYYLLLRGRTVSICQHI